MKYMGSKAKYFKYYKDIILNNRKEDQYYVEPFVGGANSIDKVDGKRIGSDINCYIIELFKALQNDWEPPDNITEDIYKSLKYDKNDKSDKYLKGFVGIGCSFGGKWFGGYARGKNNKGVDRNYCLEHKNNLLKQKSKIQGIDFKCCNYYELDIPDNSIVYCDPPYETTTDGYSNKIDYKHYWDWVRELSKNNEVFCSEYNAPYDFECLWEMETSVNFDSNRNGKVSKNVKEKLFKFKG